MVLGGGGGEAGDPDFKWQGWSKDFLGFEILIPGFFGVVKYGKYFFGWLELSRDFFGYSEHSEFCDSAHKSYIDLNT